MKAPQAASPAPPFAETVLRALLSGLQEDYAASRPRSRELYQRAVSTLPGGNSRYQLYFAPFPFYAAHASGPRIWDVDGHEYIDLVNNYTSLVHGHLPGDLAGVLQERAAAGTAFGAPTSLEVELAEELCRRIASVERVRFANSGTEACSYAIRAARAFTGRDRIIKIEGGYHGGVDPVQVSVKRLGPEVGVPVAEAGVPQVVARETYVIPFNDTARATELVHQVGHECAGLIVEPLQGSAGMLPAKREFLHGLREVTEATGCLLIFDEVMSLRIAYGGAQEHYGVRPDLTAMGKIIGGGLPVGAFGGREDVMAVLDPRSADAVMHAGTFNANPLTMAAGLETLRLLTRERVAEINARGDRFRDRLNTLARERGVPMVATGMGSLLQVHPGTDVPTSLRGMPSGPRTAVEAFFYLMLSRQVFVAPNRGLMNVSTAIGDAEQEVIDRALESSMAELERAHRAR